ncbi:OLC1v1017373C1 [Oldenlandia corymbosa var. corymbosa]|uniref:OLC1v1017373C1 n=1 Tax=Oldenlandia corymbosa var. corymbosa TaxID=529605 RepID=A0AAV1E9H0_OLDCO|nr:OLC1v1017373C1 [Oldenlandia corymbosa var. corymbosa]
MYFFQFPRTTFRLLLVLFLLSFANEAFGSSRQLFSLYQPPPMALTYHKGDLLYGYIPVSILWYGKFSPAQKSIVVDFLNSLTPGTKVPVSSPRDAPSVSQWWQTVETYLEKAGKKQTSLVLTNQISDENCSLGKILKKSQITRLARRVNSKPGGLTIVLTGQDVAVEGFCSSNCGYHGWHKRVEKNMKNSRSAFIWVGNSVTQCPGQCAWPFYKPIYGPQTDPLVAPNGDVGIDGMVVNIASLLAGAVTNPYGKGYFQGPATAPLEAASACPGVYGKGAYPGYAGELLVEKTSGASYNAVGTTGRRYLLPALVDPKTLQCATLV